MIEIDRIVLREIHLPLKEPFRISSGVCETRRIFLLELHDASGATTWSECVAGEAPNYSPETIETAWIAISQWVAPRVLGRRFAMASEVRDEFARDFRGHLMAKAAVEMGAWALEAEMRGMPLSRLVGGTRDRIATGISLGIQSSPEALVERAGRAIAEGYRKVKIKIMPGADVEYVTAARRALGDEAPLMADANNAYDIDDTAALEALDGLGLMMIEQPLACDDLVRHATLQKRLRIRLKASARRIRQAQAMAVPRFFWWRRTGFGAAMRELARGCIAQRSPAKAPGWSVTMPMTAAFSPLIWTVPPIGSWRLTAARRLRKLPAPARRSGR